MACLQGMSSFIAGAGDDQITISAGGNDTLVFSPEDGDGDDTVIGFTASTADSPGDKIDLSAFDLTAEELMAGIDLFGGNVRIDLTEHGGGKIVLNGVIDIDSVDVATGDADTDGELDMVSIVGEDGSGVFII